MEPIVTMHHFTSPKWLIEQGGWENPETVEKFAAYCSYVVQQLGFSMTFSLVAVDRSTKRRTPKESLAYLGSFCEK